MFGRPHMAGLNDFCSGLCESGASRKLSPVWYCSSLGGSEKAGQANLCWSEDILLNSLIHWSLRLSFKVLWPELTKHAVFVWFIRRYYGERSVRQSGVGYGGKWVSNILERVSLLYSGSQQYLYSSSWTKKIQTLICFLNSFIIHQISG